MNQPPFLRARWEQLILANYQVDPSELMPYLPAGTSLDYYHGGAYVSLVGFMFRQVRVMGIPVPFHIHFPEVNLRFYVKVKEGEEWKRGVVFISEIVPKPAISWVANRFFAEHYRTMRMAHGIENAGGELSVYYRWKFGKTWNGISCAGSDQPVAFAPGSAEDYITQHFWGYSKWPDGRLAEYRVEHPAWRIYPVRNYKFEVDFEELYGKPFGHLKDRVPDSVMLAEGSPVRVFQKRLLKV